MVILFIVGVVSMHFPLISVDVLKHDLPFRSSHLSQSIPKGSEGGVKVGSKVRIVSVALRGKKRVEDLGGEERRVGM